MDRLFDELGKTKPADKRWGALMSVLKESLEHHIEEEEEELFKKARKSFDTETATEMAEKFTALKKKFVTELKAGKKLKQKPSHSLEK